MPSGPSQMSLLILEWFSFLHFLFLPQSQDNAELRQKMHEMEKALEAAKHKTKPNSSQKEVPPGKRQPKKVAPPEDDGPSDDPGSAGESEVGGENEISEAAKRQRLRRLCEKKGSGKLHVPESIHQLWLKGGHTRDELLHMLEEAGWDKEGPESKSFHFWIQVYANQPLFMLFLCGLIWPPQETFVTKVTRSKETIARKSSTKKRGWYTQERMKTHLGWSKSPDSKKSVARYMHNDFCCGFKITCNKCRKSMACLVRSWLRQYIASVVKFCEKKGNIDKLTKSPGP